jgi:predicted dinucleotide-binding enzyme
MRVAIIGTGNVGGVLADRLADKGHEVVLAASTADSAKEAARDIDARPAASPSEAARAAEAVILAVPADALGEVAAEIQPHVDGKPVVDVSNGPKAVEEGQSLAEELQERLPEAHVVKAFNSAFASKMAEPHDGDQPLDGFIAGNDDAAKQAVASLVRDVGFEPVDVGDLKRARTLEGMAWINISLNMEHGWPWQSAWRLERN